MSTGMRNGTATVLPFPAQDERAEPAARARVRLEPTRRGRRLLTALAFVLGLLVAVGVMLSLDLSSARAGDEATAPVTITVQEGETLWELAQDHAPAGMSEQEFITEVRLLNKLSAPRVAAGQVLELPEAETAR